MAANHQSTQANASVTSLESLGAKDRMEQKTAKDLETTDWSWFKDSSVHLVAASIFGIIFGFLLQKGGVAKFDILVGILILENFTVVKVMVSAIIVGMVGVLVLKRLGVIEPQINETQLGANIIGGLIFGVGFGFIAYCPGTDAAALGQGNLDALIGIVGMIVGSYLFALATRVGIGKVNQWGNRGKITLPSVFGVSDGKFVAIAAPVLVVLLIVLEIFL